MKKIISIAWLILVFSFLSAIEIDHYSPQNYSFGADQEIRLNVLYGAEQISEIKLVWKRSEELQWRKENMSLEATGSYWYTATLRSKDLKDYDIQYYFEVVRTDGQIEKFPDPEGVEPVYTLMPGSVTGTYSDAFILLSEDRNPSQGSEYILAVSFFDIMDQIDLSSIKVWVGGKDVTKRATITDNALVYKDSNPTPGRRRAMVTAEVNGEKLRSEIWTTDVPINPNRSFLPLNLRGNFNFVSNLNSLSTDSPNTAFLSRVDDATGKLDLYSTYGILNLQTNLLVSSLESSEAQPVNRYTFGLQLPVLDVYVGDYSPTLSDFTIANRNVRGISAKFHTRFLSLSAVYGSTLRALSSKDDITGNPTTATFRQEAIGARLQMGNDERFRLGFSLSRHRDIKSSLDALDYSYVDGADTVFVNTPRDNAVAAVDIRLNIPNQYFILGGEIAGSLLNRNTLPGAMSQAEIEEYMDEDLPIDVDPADYADYFVINKNMEPLLPSMENVAWNAYLRTIFLKNIIDLRYSEVGSAFNALGTYYQQQDTRQLSVTDQLNFGNIVILGGSFSMMEDNRSGFNQETNKTTSWNAQAALRIPRWPYLKAAYFSNAIVNDLNPTLVDPGYVFEPVERTSDLISFGIGYNFTQIPYVPTALDVTYRMGMDNADKNNAMWYENSNNSVNVSLNNRFQDIPLRTQLVFSYQTNNRDETNDAMLYPLQDNNNMNIQLNADYSLFNRMLRPFARLKLLSLGGDQDDQSFNYYTIGVEAMPLRDLTISTELNIQDYKNNDTPINDYSNLTWRFMLNQRF